MPDQELKHYGVKGMKWGVRKNPSKTYARASREADKRKANVVKYQQKATKQRLKTNKRLARVSLTDLGRDKERRMLKRLAKAESKAYKAQKKSQRFEKSMRKTFANVKVSDISKEDLEVGRAYVYMLLNE